LAPSYQLSRTFVLGDIHGAYLALRQCLERSGFDRANDRLIFLGDVCDGWPQTRECIDELMTIPHLVCLLGNHDFWFHSWMANGEAEDMWVSQGGQATIDSYKEGIPPEHASFVAGAKLYHEESNRLFVHAGIPPGKRPEECSQHQLLWDRTLPILARSVGPGENIKLTHYDEVYIGHTPITSPHPLKYCEVWMMDTGAGWSGVLSMMNVDTKECFTSDPVPELYPGVEGRRRW
jgi:serine/threonine protein phosphatase 1